MSADEEDELLFEGPIGVVESELRKVLRELQIEKDTRKQSILKLQMQDLKQRLLSEPPRDSQSVPAISTAEDSTATFDGDIGPLERTLRLAFDHRMRAVTEPQKAGYKREIDSCVELLRSPLVQSSGSNMIAYRRVWEYLRIGSVSALATVDPLILRAVRDNSSGHSLLHKAALFDSDSAVVSHLIQVGGCDVNAIDHVGQTPLHIAVQMGNLKLAKLLIEANADITLQDNTTRTPLYNASRSTIDYLIGADSDHLESLEHHSSLIPEAFRIPLESFDIKECIGEGTSGRVFSGVYNQTAVAIKIIKKSQTTMRELQKEIEILSHLSHPNLVRLLGVATSTDSFHLVTELCSGGSVYSYLHEMNQRFSPVQIVSGCRDIVRGLAYMHSRSPRILHMDLKSRNLLLQYPPSEGEKLEIKIADFGIARNSQSSSPRSFAGTWWWMSPEALFGEEVSDKTDMYSFGMCLYEMMSGIVPYSNIPEITDMPPVTVAIKISSGFRPDISIISPDIVSILPRLIDLMEKCWNNDPTLRPTAQEALDVIDKISF